MKLELAFTVTEKGRAQNVRVVKPTITRFSGDVELKSIASRMVFSVRGWKFEPALDQNDQAVAVKVRLPIHIVKGEGGKTKALASLVLDKDVEKQS